MLLFKNINADSDATEGRDAIIWSINSPELGARAGLLGLEDVQHGFRNCHLMGQGTKRDLPLCVRASSLQITNISFYV